MGLKVSGSHDPCEIACQITCEIACNLMMLFVDMRYAQQDAGDEATSESHEGMHLAPVDDFSVVFFS